MVLLRVVADCGSAKLATQMYFNKYPYRANFTFAEAYDVDSGKVAANGREFDASIEHFEGDITHLRVSSRKAWPKNQSLETLVIPKSTKERRVSVGSGFEIAVEGKRGVLLRSVPAEGFGVSGPAWMFQFEIPEGTKFFGAGEKTFGTIELSGYRTKFWNTDVWSDFPSSQWTNEPTDPPYFSTPYLALRIGDSDGETDEKSASGEWVGFLLHTPHPSFIETPGIDESRVFVEWQRTSKHLILGAEGGEPNLWIIYAPSLAELTRKLQKLVGVTPRPPMWALGYHQSRYGYGGHADLVKLDQQFLKHEIPCDALWLDLDYMDGFRVFKTSEEMFPDGVLATTDSMREHGRRIVPILDPGVKFEKGYSVYEGGHERDVFCRNHEGREFVGLVWPGETVFPDFTQATARDWWAEHVQRFAEAGFAAAWADMNDPSTGPVDPHGMLFNHGRDSHSAHHNQYALGMQIATVEGLKRARPLERPFLLSRSGYTGSSKYCAIWTGDNVSNYFYLGIAIPTSLGMSLSGLPFNGPDAGGFGGDADEELIVDWFKLGFLFPFFRNHSMKGSRAQEPFAYPIGVLRILRRYIRLRYKLLPYLYNLFVTQEVEGDPILRPLLYEFDETGLENIDDAFMVGPSLLQAPFVEKAKTRRVVLPGSEAWYDARSGIWVAPGEHVVRNRVPETPLYFRAGAIVPMRIGTPTDNRTDLLDVHFHIFVPPAWSGESSYEYVADDGETIAYRAGAVSSQKVLIVSIDGNLAISTEVGAQSFGNIAASFVLHGEVKSVRINGAAVTPEKAKVTLSGKPLEVALLRG